MGVDMVGAGGYMVMAGVTTRYLFDLQPGDVYWCTADCGWITGHTYLTYGPLLNGATCVMYEGVPSYPTPGRVWDIVEKYRVRPNSLFIRPITSLGNPFRVWKPRPIAAEISRVCGLGPRKRRVVLLFAVVFLMVSFALLFCSWYFLSLQSFGDCWGRRIEELGFLRQRAGCKW